MKTKFILLLILPLSYFPLVPAQDESTICRNLFVSSFDITKSSTEVISLAVDAVWAASGITGVKTTTGSLTQSQYNPNSWSYSSSPNDKLNLNFANGVVVSFTFYQIDGYMEGDEEDFKNSHLMDFNTFIQDNMNMRINSNTSWPQYGLIQWQRTISGSIVYSNELTTLNVNHNGKINYDISGSFADYMYTEQASGTSSTSSYSVNISETYWRRMIHNSDAGIFAMNTEITNNSTTSINGNTYKYQNGYVIWAAGTKFADSASAGIYNQVIDAGYWKAQGIMLKNGQAYGTLMFSTPVVANTYGPNLVLHLNSGSNYFLHTLIDDPLTNLDEEPGKTISYELMQNYPNPFNSQTVIRWFLKEKSNVRINIYNTVGSLVETILDEERPVGLNEIKYKSNLPSGVYFYRITAGSFTAARKMILLK